MRLETKVGEGVLNSLPLNWKKKQGVPQFCWLFEFAALESRYRYQDSKSCKFPHKTEESVARAGIVTASVTTLGHKLGMLFLLAEYYIEGEGVMNKVTVMIRAKLNGKYPYGA